MIDIKINEDDPRYIKVLRLCNDVNRVGYIYIIQADTGEYKIGRSKNVPDRIKLFAIKLPFEFEIVHYFPVDDMYLREARWHKHFQNQHIRGEWFNLSPLDIDFLKCIAGQVADTVIFQGWAKWRYYNRPVRYVPNMYHRAFSGGVYAIKSP